VSARLAAAIAVVREAWRLDDGAEGDSVRLICDEAERLTLELAAVAAERDAYAAVSVALQRHISALQAQPASASGKKEA